MNITEPFEIKNKQKRASKETHHSLDTFIDLVENNINNAKQRKKTRTKEEKTTMKALAERFDFVITNSDKCGAVAIMNTDDYINEANCIVRDKDNYKQLPNEPLLQHNEMVNNKIESFQ